MTVLPVSDLPVDVPGAPDVGSGTVTCGTRV